MIRRAAALVLALLATGASPAAAWDPFDEWTGRPEPPAFTPRADPAPFIAPPPGLYYVTDTYVADVVTKSGPLTTYSTTTVHESTGSYARVLDTVGTGTASSFDGAAFNGRTALSDGRAVAGTYYENYVVTNEGFVPVSVVFFQDDAELARQRANAEMPRASAPLAVPVAPSQITAPPPSASCCSGAGSPGVVERETRDIEPPRLTVRPGLSLVPASAPLTRIEVLRGRVVSVWLRAFAGDREVPVRAWSLASGDPGDPVSTSGNGATPFRTSWTRLAPPGSAYELVFRLEVDTPETGRRLVDARFAVSVRSPALQD
jgi:hypothetical protein